VGGLETDPSMTRRSLSRAIVCSDVICRVVVGGFAGVVAIRSGRLCPTGEECNGPGFEKLLVAPAILYAVWQLVAIGWEVVWGLTERDEHRSQRNVMIIVIMTLPRLVWVTALLSVAVVWPVALILTTTILTLVLAAVFAWTARDVVRGGE
jgi:hypothetical protein